MDRCFQSAEMQMCTCRFSATCALRLRHDRHCRTSCANCQGEGPARCTGAGAIWLEPLRRQFAKSLYISDFRRPQMQCSVCDNTHEGYDGGRSSCFPTPTSYAQAQALVDERMST